MSKRQSYTCACAFAKTVRDRNPCNFPRIGMTDNVLYRGHWIVEHAPSGVTATIADPRRGPLHAEADTCCFSWFMAPQPEEAAE